MLDAMKHITDVIFFFQEDSASSLCMQHSPTATALSTNAAFE